MNTLPLNKIADEYQKKTLFQRLHAVNRSLASLRVAAKKCIRSIRKLDETLGTLFQAECDRIMDEATHASYEIKNDLKLVGSSNQYWIQLQPMCTEDDLNKFMEFHTLSNQKVVRDFVSFCNIVDANITECQEQAYALVKAISDGEASETLCAFICSKTKSKKKIPKN